MKKNQTLDWLTSENKEFRLPIIFLSFLSLVLSLTAILFAYFSKEVIDQAILSNMNLFIKYSIIISLILVIQILASALNHYLKIYYMARLENKLRRKLFNKIVYAKLSVTSKDHSGSYLNYLTSDTHVVSDSFIDLLPKVIFNLFRFLGAFIFLSLLDFGFALILFSFGLFVLIFSRLLSKIIKTRHHDFQNSEANLKSFVQESIINIPVIKSFEVEPVMDAKLGEFQGKYFKALLKKNNVSIFTATGMQIFIGFGYGFAIIFGAYKLMDGILSFGTLTAMIQLVAHIQSPFAGMSQIIPKYYQMMASSERLMVLDKLVAENEKNVENIKNFDLISFKNLQFSYEKSPNIFNLNFEIEKFDFVQILGESGKGKTTLFKLLLGLIEPTKGSIEIKDNNQFYHVSKNTRNLFAYVPQENFILSGTIKENLELYQKASMDQMIKACKIAHIYDDIMSLENQFDTHLKEKGIGLSEGQLQRLQIARALIKDSKILLLDEITSSLDLELESKIFKSIKELTDKTVIIVSHRKLPDHLVNKKISL
jgi:ATP-binding cassette subfamily B protein